MTREKILSAAKELFEEKGFESTTVREIASSAGVNVALINYHFGSKEHLLASLVEETTAQVHLKLSDITKSAISSIEKINLAIELFTDRIFSNKRYYQMIHRELSMTQRPNLNTEIAKPLKRNRDELRKIIEEGQKKKAFKKNIDVDLTISTIFGIMYQTTHIGFKAKVIDGHQLDDEMLKERVKKHLKEMLKCYLEK